MSSNLACLGFQVGSKEELDALVGQLIARTSTLGAFDGRAFLRWQDPSGVRVAFERSARGIERFVPSYAGTPGARLAGIERLNEAAWMVDVLDEADEIATRAAIDLEQGDLAAAGPTPRLASVIALGNVVRVYPSAEAFAQSPDSLLAPNAEPSNPPPHFVERGWPWPPRVAAESFMSYGAFAEPATARADARMYGTVLSAEERTNTHSGLGFAVVRTRTAGMEVDLCLEALEDEPLPQPGQVVGGNVYLVGSFDGVDVVGQPRPSFLGRLGIRKA